MRREGKTTKSLELLLIHLKMLPMNALFWLPYHDFADYVIGLIAHLKILKIVKVEKNRVIFDNGATITFKSIKAYHKSDIRRESALYNITHFDHACFL